jgi:hypothetical protein
LRITAVLEGGAALAFLVWPSIPVWVLFGRPIAAGFAELFVRYAGAALLSLSIACWFADHSGRATRALIAAMTLYDVLALGLLADAGLGLSLAGPLLWPAVGLHAALALWSLATLSKTAAQGAELVP